MNYVDMCYLEDAAKENDHMLEDLVGYRLESMDNDGFIVSKDGVRRKFKFFEDYGDCCGFNELCTNVITDDDELMPVITRVTRYTDEEIVPSTIQFDNIGQCSTDPDNNMVRVVFYGVNKPIAEINSLSSSGSGWAYGACVVVVCEELKEYNYLSKY